MTPEQELCQHQYTQSLRNVWCFWCGHVPTHAVYVADRLTEPGTEPAHVTYRASTALLVLFLALFVSSCVSGPEMPTGPIKFQCYDQATGQWEDCPEILDEDMKCHEEEQAQSKDQA
jgi:hypothetical protein